MLSGPKLPMAMLRGMQEKVEEWTRVAKNTKSDHKEVRAWFRRIGVIQSYEVGLAVKESVDIDDYDVFCSRTAKALTHQFKDEFTLQLKRGKTGNSHSEMLNVENNFDDGRIILRKFISAFANDGDCDSTQVGTMVYTKEFSGKINLDVFQKMGPKVKAMMDHEVACIMKNFLSDGFPTDEWKFWSPIHVHTLSFSGTSGLPSGLTSDSASDWGISASESDWSSSASENYNIFGLQRGLRPRLWPSASTLGSSSYLDAPFPLSSCSWPSASTLGSSSYLNAPFSLSSSLSESADDSSSHMGYLQRKYLDQ
jgi:hypothetical protein